jgi:putative ABC transport system permease protein
MFSNYLKIALRSLNKNRLHTIINITGLSLGVASVFLISLYIQYEAGYDTYYDQYENLYRITWEDENPQTRTPHPMAQAMAEDFPEVENAVTLSPLWAAGLTREIFSVRNLQKDIKFDERNVLAVDSTFFDVFRFPVTRGDANKALRSTSGILISESTAKKYFGDEDPIGKQLAVNFDTVLLEVMAVFQDVPAQSHFHFDFLISYVREKSFDGEDEYYSWKDFGHYNYIRLKPGTDAKALEAKIMPWMRKYIDISDEDYRSALKNNMGFRLQPVTDIHLKSHLRWELEPNGNIEYVYTMTGAALLTLLIACINFMNLMTAKSTERAKEIGIRKTLGAMRQQLSFQFLGESVLITMVSIVFGALIVEACLPLYNIVTGQALNLDYRISVPILVALGLVIGVGAGIYPSLFLSSIKPHLILKGKFQTSNQGNGLRNGLIVFQFAISMALISAAVIIFNQLKFIQEKNLGFNKEEVLVVPLKNGSLSRRMEALKTELLKVQGVTSVSASSNLPGGQFNQNSVTVVEFPDNDINFSEVFVDYDFLKTMNIELAEGRFFLPENRADNGLSFVINETGAKQLFLDQPIGKELHWEAYGRGLNGKVIGMVKDFHFQSLHEPVRPLLFVLYPAYNHLVIKLKPDNFDAAITQIKNIYTQFDDSFAFEFSFLDENLTKQYQSEQRTGVIFSAFAFIAIGIACFGLFGMAMLTFGQRIKEVSIRKVLGASVSGLIVFLLKDFTKLILLAILLATPLAWWAMDLWLDNFIYQVGIHPIIFILSGLGLLILSWVTLSYFTLKTSRLNPAETLKNE